MIEDETLVKWFDTLRGDGHRAWIHAIGLGIVGGIGVGTFGVHILHLLTQSEGTYTRLLGTFVPMGLSAVLLVIALRAHQRRDAEAVARIGAWCFVGAIVIVAMGVISIVYQRANGVPMTNIPVVLTNHATVGAILGALIGTYDGERHQQRRDLHAEHERARQLSNRLTILNRVFRHDIRNAVNVILGHATHIRDGRIDRTQATTQIEKKARELQEMSDCARRLERLLDRQTATTRPVDIGPSLRAKASALADEGVAVETTVPESVEVLSTPLIEEAIDELLDNAVQHNDASTPRLTIAVQSETSGNAEPETVEIQIRDNGPGIPEHELDVLERGHETELRHSSGLGLWFVHWVVDASNGWIAFDRNHPRGSVVELHLPSASVEETDADHPHGKSRLDAVSRAAHSAFDRRDGSATGDR